MGRIDSDMVPPDELEKAPDCKNLNELQKFPEFKTEQAKKMARKLWGDSYQATDITVRRHSYQVLAYKIPNMLYAIECLEDPSALREVIGERKAEAAYGILNELSEQSAFRERVVRLFGLDKKETYDKMLELADREYYGKIDKINNSSLMGKLLTGRFERNKVLDTRIQTKLKIDALMGVAMK